MTGSERSFLLLYIFSIMRSLRMRYKRTYMILGAVAALVFIVHMYKSGKKEKSPLTKTRMSSGDRFQEHYRWSIKDVFSPSKFKDLPEDMTSKCEFSKKQAETDYQSLYDIISRPEILGLFSMYDVWDKMTSVGNEDMLEDTLWYTVTFNKSTVRRQPKLKVFVMPHCHADPGWLRTYEDYSRDTDNALNYMLKFLPSHPEMTFTWMEVSFFQLWWSHLSAQEKDITKQLIKKGQLELTSGSWTMTDEANPYFWATINNIVDGHQWFYKELGFLPNVMWSNDPFGYGPSVPWLFEKAGINKLIINRVHRTVKMQLQRHKAIPFRWRQSWDVSGGEDILTDVLPFQHYDIPNSCGPDDYVCCQFDFKRLTNFQCPGPMPVPITDQNVAERAELLYEQYRKTASIRNLNVQLSLLGDDFRYIDELEWHQQYDNYMKLFKYMNSREDWNIEASFGTFSQYFEALEGRHKTTEGHKFPTLAGDFFPYHDFADHYWTGYYTTRPFYKRVDRMLQSYIRAADILFSLASSRMHSQARESLLSSLSDARLQSSLFQHHDAITGTSRYAAVHDYGVRLHEALLTCRNIIAIATTHLLNPSQSPTPNPVKKFVLNEVQPAYNVNEVKSPILVTENQPKSVTIFNPLPYLHEHVIRLHISTPQVIVTHGDTVIHGQINPVLEYLGAPRADLFELVFFVTLPALSLQSVTLTFASKQPESTVIAEIFTNIVNVGQHKDPKFSRHFHVKALNPKLAFRLHTNYMTSIHSPENGLVTAYTTKHNDLWRELAVQFWYYTNTRSGAYLFSPTSPPELWPLNATQVIYAYKGPIVAESHSYLGRLYHNTVLYNTSGLLGKQIELNNVVDLREYGNLEVVMRIQSDVTKGLINESIFYTDSIGLQFLKRHNHPNQPIQRNYYPMPSAAFIHNASQRLTIIGGHPHGVAAPIPGTLEIMLDRILDQDDYKGLGNGIDSLIRDNLPSISQFRILPETIVSEHSNVDDGKRFAYHSMEGRVAIDNLLYPPMILTSIFKSDEAQRILVDQPESQQYNPVGINSGVACDVNLVMLRSLSNSTTQQKLLILLRHGVDCTIPATVNMPCLKGSMTMVQRLVKELGVTSSQEMNLSGVIKRESVNISANPPKLNSMDVKTFAISNE